ncbi:4'-phosphopantetheinyl transferase superfamily protein [Mycoplasmopsis primatum]|uniref:4'-phosphopantetheinyl transferase superfamily protein n=1 Tax=Mycoplasmopsis primatum TaxID=55604 RepID=UPI0004985973|nr:4'-phosphopantetheinyl transferase superfamily protein [Mycoplasmopsis primatum]
MFKAKIGVDMTSLSRFSNVNENFIKRILSVEELREYENIELESSKIKYLAIKWSIKESMFKINNNYSAFNKITIFKKRGKYYHPGFDISTSCEGDLIISVVLAI